MKYTYNAKPPYPKNEDEYSCMGVCWLIIEDTSKKINFRNDALFFEVDYTLNGKTIGSIRSYLASKEDMGDYIFNYVVEYDTEFKITIDFPNDFDLSALKVKFTKKEVNINSIERV